MARNTFRSAGKFAPMTLAQAEKVWGLKRRLKKMHSTMDRAARRDKLDYLPQQELERRIERTLEEDAEAREEGKRAPLTSRVGKKPRPVISKIRILRALSLRPERLIGRTDPYALALVSSWGDAYKRKVLRPRFVFVKYGESVQQGNHTAHVMPITVLDAREFDALVLRAKPIFRGSTGAYLKAIEPEFSDDY
jgi:hypothetical protein